MLRLLLLILLFLILGGVASAGTVNNPSVYEGNNVTITYDLGYAAPVSGLEVRVETASGSATRDVDFSISANQLGYRTITSGSTSISITATTVDEGVVEGSEVFPVAFMENVSSDPGFDNGASNWVGATITTQPLIDLTSLSPPMGNNVLHIKDKEEPHRDFTLQTGEDYTVELEWSEASGDGSGNACDDSSIYPGFVNFADTLRFEVEDLGGTSSVPWTTLYDDPGNVGLAQYSGDENFNFSGESVTFTWTGSGTARLRLSVLDASGRQYEGYCGFVVDDFRLNKQMVQATVTINDPDPAPTVSSVSVPADNTYAASDNLDFTVNASENVTVSGTPQLALTIGSTSRQADYVSGSGTSALVFRYTVQSGDLDTDGIVVGSLSANGGTLRDSANNDMSLALNSVGNTTAVLVDASAPTVSSVSVPADNTYAASDNLDFTVNASENVTVSGTPQLALTIGSTSRQADYVSGSGTSALVFRYTVQSGDLDTDGIVVGSLSANGGTLRDSANNDMSLALNSVGNTTAVLVDASAPTVSSVSVPADNTYAASDNLDFTVNASENVTVSGTPQLALTIGSTSRQADYVSGSGTSALVFRYTVQSGDLDTDGIVVGSLSANGGTLRDSANNDMSLALNSVGNTTAVTVNVNVSALTVNISSSDVVNGSSSSLNSVTVAFATSENTTDFSLSDISVANAVVSSFSGSNSNYTAVITPISNGSVSLFVASGTFTDSLSQANIASSIYTWIYDPNLALVDDALTDTQTIMAKQVTTQGKTLLTASQNLIQTSIDHLLVRTQLQAQRRERSGTQTASQQQSPEETAVNTSSSSFNEQETFADRFADAIKLLDIDVDDFGYSGALNFDLYEPLSGRNTALITKVKASVSDQDNGPETSNITASYALESDSDDRKTIYARFLHLTKSKSDFRFEHSGTQDSKGISAGLYSIYSPRIDHLVTIFGSLGVAQTDLALTTSSARVNDSYISLNLQTGVTLSQTYHREGMIFAWEMAAEALYSRQRSRYANVLIGSTNYPARVDASVVKDIMATLTPKFIFNLKDLEDEMPSNLQFAPSVRCGNGTGGGSCGYGVSASFNRMSADRDGHVTLGMSLDRYRKTDTTSLFMDIEGSLPGYKSIRLDTHLEQNFLLGDASGQPDYRISSVVRLPLQQ